MSRDVWTAVAGSTRYEFWMQLRRRAVWITFFVFGLLVFTGSSNPWNFPVDTPLMNVVADWAFVLQVFMPVAFGVLLADRLPRDRRTRVGELLETLPAPSGGRLLGKYAGGILATLVPLFLIYAAGIAYMVAERQDLRAIPLGLAAFVAINLPGLLFVAAFSVACPTVLWMPLYQFLFVGYWFWGNLLNPAWGIPTISGTWLTPVGQYMLKGFFGGPSLWVGSVAAWEGIVSIGLLLGLAALALLCAHQYLSWQKARQ